MTRELETDIRALAFFAADHAVAVEGKLYVNGGFWDRLNIPAFPHAVPAVSIAAVLRIPYRAYHQDHTMSVGLEDADGNPLPLRIDGQFRVGAEPYMKHGDPTTMPLAFNVNGILIERAGDYAFTLSVDQTEIERFTFRAAQVAAPIIPPAAADQPGSGLANPPE